MDPRYTRPLRSVIQEHVQRAGHDEERAEVEEYEEVPPLPPFPQRAGLVLGHPEDDRYGAESPHPVQSQVARRIARRRPERRPREHHRDEEGQSRGRQKERSIRPASASPGEPIGEDAWDLAWSHSHKNMVAGVRARDPDSAK